MYVFICQHESKNGPSQVQGCCLIEILGISAKLGITSFGGPIAHLGYFREEYVVRRKWLDERAYADLVALGQFLPGPASSQVGIGIGVIRGGLLGGLIAWLGFTLPSVIALVVFAYAMQGFGLGEAGWIHGLKLVAVAVVAHAVLAWAVSWRLIGHEHFGHCDCRRLPALADGDDASAADCCRSSARRLAVPRR